MLSDGTDRVTRLLLIVVKSPSITQAAASATAFMGGCRVNSPSASETCNETSRTRHKRQQRAASELKRV